jgi:hypothetical protein
MGDLKILVIDNIFMLGKMFGSGIGINARRQLNNPGRRGPGLYLSKI